MPKNKEVDAWLKASEHPLKPAIKRVREIILRADKRVGECIKWKSPTFTFEGNIASINPNTKKKVSLMFHRGVELKSKALEGGGDTVRYMYFDDLAAVEAKEKALTTVIKQWCKLKSS